MKKILSFICILFSSFLLFFVGTVKADEKVCLYQFNSEQTDNYVYFSYSSDSNTNLKKYVGIESDVSNSCSLKYTGVDVTSTLMTTINTQRGQRGFSKVENLWVSSINKNQIFNNDGSCKGTDIYVNYSVGGSSAEAYLVTNRPSSSANGDSSGYFKLGYFSNSSNSTVTGKVYQYTNSSGVSKSYCNYKDACSDLRNDLEQIDIPYIPVISSLHTEGSLTSYDNKYFIDTLYQTCIIDFNTDTTSKISYSDYKTKFDSSVNITIDSNKQQCDSSNIVSITPDVQESYTETYDIISCGGVELPAKTINLVNIFITILQVATPVIIIIFGMIDLAKAVSASKADDIKKGQQTFIRRLISGVMVFLVIVVVKIVLGLLNNSTQGAISCIDAIFNGTGSVIHKAEEVKNTRIETCKNDYNLNHDDEQWKKCICNVVYDIKI